MRSTSWQAKARWRRAALLLGLAPATLMALVACSEREPPPESKTPASDGGAALAPIVPKSATPETLAKADAGIPDNAVQLGAVFMQTPIMNDMEWPLPESATKEDRRRDPTRAAAMRIGYIRRGSKVFVLPEPHKKENCKDGWYELVGGGFVCGKYATVDLNHPKIKTAPHPPYMNAALPYDYGYNVGNGTPLYRHVPSWDERVKLEPWLSPQARPKRGIEENNPYAIADAGAPTLVNTSSTDPLGAGLDPLDAGPPGTPWYLRDYDGGKPTVTLDELREDEGGPVVRRMVKGFYLALDKETKDNRNVKWWKTTEGFVAPYTRIFVNKSVSDFHGVWLTGALPEGAPTTPGNPPAADAGAPLVKIPDALPVGFVLWRGKKYTLSDDKKSVTAGDVMPRFTSVPLTGQSIVVGNMRYEETTDGFWAKTAELVIVKDKPEGAPKDLAPGEKWIYVNLKTETLTAYEGDKPVFVTLVSTGKKSDLNKDKDHRTKAGTFRIREKHIAATMDGDVASDGPYSIEDVPWIMYFNQSIALHGAFWHSNFGHEQSHGCVNLAPLDARALFGWTEPQLPDGWHGVMSTPEKPGTRVVVFDPDCPKNDCEVHYKEE